MREIELYRGITSSSELMHRSGIAVLANVKWERNFLGVQKAIPDNHSRLYGFTAKKY